MPVYHSKFTGQEGQEMCGCALLPLKTRVRGPAPPMPDGEDDVIDETIKFFRANVLFRNFEIKNSADRTLIYLTLYLQQCLKECERAKTLSEGEKAVQQLAIRQFAIPGDTNWALGSMYPAPKSAAEGEGCKAYFKQCREELGRRIVQVLYLPDGSKNKWWQAFSKRKFMGKELRDR